MVMGNKQIRLSLDVSPELNRIIDEMAEKTHSSKSEVLIKSIALMKVAVQERDKDNHLAIVNQNQEIIKEIVGL
jgi:predicted transcriptional regulator